MTPPKGPLTIEALPGPIDATVRPPGSKSIAARALVAAALADGRSILDGFGFCDDTARLIDGLCQMGIAVTADRADERVEVTGCSGRLPLEDIEIDCGESGTMLRLCTALAALGLGDVRIVGCPRLTERPLAPLVDALRRLGAGVECLEREGHAPLVIHGRGLVGGQVAIDCSTSSQYASAVLLCGPAMRRDLFLTVVGDAISRPYIALTTAVMRDFEVELVDQQDTRFVVPAPQRYVARNYAVEPDASTASYFLAATALCGGRIRIAGLGRGARQGDVRALHLLEAMGCAVTMDDAGLTLTRDRSTPLRGLDADLGHTPDLVPTLGVCALYADSPTRLRNIAHLQHKESRRLDVLATGLRALGAEVDCGPDSLTITPPAGVTPAAMATAGDHRMAMAFALVGLRQGGLTLDHPECVSKSCPDYFDLLARLGD